MRATMLAAGAAAILVASGCSPSAVLDERQLQERTLSLSDLPTGWAATSAAADPSSAGNPFEDLSGSGDGCTQVKALLQDSLAGTTLAARTSAVFERGGPPASGGTLLVTWLGSAPSGLQEQVTAGAAAVRSCPRLTGSKEMPSVTVAEASFPTLASASTAFVAQFHDSSGKRVLAATYVLAAKGSLVCGLVLLSSGGPDPAGLEPLARAAVDKASR